MKSDVKPQEKSLHDPVGYGIPYNHLMFADYREALVEQALQILITTLDHEGVSGPHQAPPPSSLDEQEVSAAHTQVHIPR